MPRPIKPHALRSGDAIRVIAPASPFKPEKLEKGIPELQRLGFKVRHDARILARDGYFAGSAEDRRKELIAAVEEHGTRAIVCVRGGYGTDGLIDAGREWNRVRKVAPKVFLGFSDVTSLQVFFWQKFGWVTFYGPMVAAGFDEGAGHGGGYDAASFEHATHETRHGWKVDLRGEALHAGEAEGVLVGGCLTMIQATLGTRWELNTKGAILVLEDRAMKPFQVERTLTHLKHAGKLSGVRGLVCGDFPECEAPADSPTIADVLSKFARELKIPAAWNAPIGHTSRPMLTLPLGVHARLTAAASPLLEILEPACIA